VGGEASGLSGWEPLWVKLGCQISRLRFASLEMRVSFSPHFDRSRAWSEAERNAERRNPTAMVTTQWTNQPQSASATQPPKNQKGCLQAAFFRSWRGFERWIWAEKAYGLSLHGRLPYRAGIQGPPYGAVGVIFPALRGWTALFKLGSALRGGGRGDSCLPYGASAFQVPSALRGEGQVARSAALRGGAFEAYINKMRFDTGFHIL
jgi:hypothetical protein